MRWSLKREASFPRAVPSRPLDGSSAMSTGALPTVVGKPLPGWAGAAGGCWSAFDMSGEALGGGVCGRGGGLGAPEADGLVAVGALGGVGGVGAAGAAPGGAEHLARPGRALRLVVVGPRGVDRVVEPGREPDQVRVVRVLLQLVDMVEYGGQVVDGVVAPLRLRPAVQQGVCVAVRIREARVLPHGEQGADPAAAEVVEEAVESTRSFIESRGLRLTVSVASEAIRVEADATRLEQVLVNLVKNAEEAMPEGGRIVVRAERRARSRPGR